MQNGMLQTKYTLFIKYTGVNNLPACFKETSHIQALFAMAFMKGTKVEAP